MSIDKNKEPNWFHRWLDKRRADKMVRRLHSIDKNNWMYISRTLNGWKFPEEFYDLIPKWWGKQGNVKRAMNIIRPTMKEVDKVFSEKEQLRYHNVTCGRMSDGAFEYWFENCSMRSSPNEKHEENISKFYDRERFISEIEWWKDEVFEPISNALSKLTKNPSQQTDNHEH